MNERLSKTERMDNKKIVLKSGIVIYDNRHLGCGITIDNGPTRFMFLSYNSDDGFYINMSSAHLTVDLYTEFLRELMAMRLSLLEATKWWLENK